MKTTQISGTHGSSKLAGNIKFQSAGQSIQIGFTDQQLSLPADTVTLPAFLCSSGWIELQRRSLTHSLPQSNNALTPVLLGIKRVASQSVLSRFI